MARTRMRRCPECGVMFEADPHDDEDLCLACDEWARDSSRFVLSRTPRPRRLTPPEGFSE